MAGSRTSVTLLHLCVFAVEGVLDGGQMASSSHRRCGSLSALYVLCSSEINGVCSLLREGKCGFFLWL